MKQLKAMKESLTACVQSQMGRLGEVDAKELGEAVDMIKDLSEAIYYCTVTEAMESKEKEQQHQYYMEPYYNREIDKNNGRMYYDGNGHMGGGTTGGGTRNYREKEYMMPMRDSREGRSPINRRMYMETKEMHMDKAASMKELEKYVQELTHDIVEMIEDASPEEKQYLEKRVAALANKIGQTNV